MNFTRQKNIMIYSLNFSARLNNSNSSKPIREINGFIINNNNGIKKSFHWRSQLQNYVFVMILSAARVILSF